MIRKTTEQADALDAAAIDLESVKSDLAKIVRSLMSENLEKEALVIERLRFSVKQISDSFAGI